MMNKLDLRLRVERWLGVRHASDRRKAPRERRGRTGGDGLVLFAAGLAQMNVHIDQAGRNDLAACIEDQVLPVRVYVVAGNATVLDEQVRHTIYILAGIDDAASLNQDA